MKILDKVTVLLFGSSFSRPREHANVFVKGWNEKANSFKYTGSMRRGSDVPKYDFWSDVVFSTGALFSIRLDSQPKESVFCLLLKRAKGISLEPGESLDIPISFAPDTMQLYEATVTVTIHREDPTDAWGGDYPSLMSKRTVNDLHWIYPVRGIPESIPIKESQAPCIECKARSRVEERVEVSLTGLAPNSAGAGLGRYPSVTPINLLGRHMIGEMNYGVDYLNVPEEFRWAKCITHCCWSM